MLCSCEGWGRHGTRIPFFSSFFLMRFLFLMKRSMHGTLVRENRLEGFKELE